jgi:hypothetical protein
MIRDRVVAELISRRLEANGAAEREAAAALIEFCRRGMSDAEIASALTAKRHSPEVMREIRRLTDALGVSPADG